MSKQKIMIFALIGLIFAVLTMLQSSYFNNPEITTKGSSVDLALYLSFGTSIVSLLTALVGLVKSIVEARNNKGKH